MSSTTVAEFASELKKSTETLLEQLKSAGVAKTSAADALTEGDKHKLLSFLQASHGTATADRKKITLVKKSTSEIKQADATGKARTIQVEVRKKRTFIKRDDDGISAPELSAPESDDSHAPAPVIDEAELSRREEEARRQAELIRRQEEELAERRRQREAQEAREREQAEQAEQAEKAAEAAAAAATPVADSDATPAPATATAAAVAAQAPLPAATESATTTDAPVDADAAKKAAIAAAMERARLQREAAQPKNTDGLTIAQRKEIAAIEARRAPLQAQQNTSGAETQSSQKDQQ